MARVIWKGAVSFGLVHIPVALVPATVQRGIDFDWLDRRSMDPVGYKRINKTTGAEVTGDDIVRGVQYEKHRYVVLGDEEIRAAYPAATRTIDIVAFVDAGEIGPIHFDTPYYLAPEARGEKVYALLREALAASGQAGLAKVVLRNTQHLALLIPFGPGLLLNTLRWPEEVRDIAELALPEAATKARLDPRELEMARRLIADMHEEWVPARYKNEFTAQIMELVERKARQGKLETVGETAEEAGEGAEVIDLADLLRRSLGRKEKAAAPAGKAVASGRRSRKKAG